MNNRTGSIVLGVLALCTATGIMLFWAGFFTIGMAPENPPMCYFEYEYAFPFPDLVLALALLIGGVLLLKRSHYGNVVSMPCAGALIFLGLLDASFNFQNGIYMLSAMDMVLNGFLNLWCVVFGLALIMRLKHIHHIN